MKINNKQLYNKLSGRYDIIEQIGAGGMSYVYKAFDEKRKKIVAIKILKEELAHDEEIVDKFKTEAIACKDIRHTNVISAFDVIDEENIHYIVMEYIEGIPLNKYIKNKGKLSNEETIEISLQVASGILAAHKKGIIHRDIKPQNIVITDKGIAKITDFGIARAITSTTRNISVVGTVHYISPEQVRNTTVDFRTDIYSLGCTMYEMITGIVPFVGETPLEIVISHLRENIKEPKLDNPNIYQSLNKIILKSTRMIPKERYQSMDDMIADLEEALIDKTGSYINDVDFDDEEGKTVIISDEDMKVIKAVSEKFSNKNSYKKDNDNLTPEQKEFFDRYIKNGAYKQHVILRNILIGIAIISLTLICLVAFMIFDTRKSKFISNDISTGSEVLNDLVSSLKGIDYSIAENFAKDYGVKLNIISNEFNDDLSYGKIIRVENNNIGVNNSLDIIISKGAFVLDFSDKNALNNIKWSDMIYLLNDRGLDYETSEINDLNVPRGYIIGVNKKRSDEPGKLVFTISRGISDNIKAMPDLYNKQISEVKEILEKYELVLGSISYKRDYNILENNVVKQSVEKGAEVKSGSVIDLVLSSGPMGIEYNAVQKNHWHSRLNSSFKVTKDYSPYIDNDDGKLILQVRLMQKFNNTDAIYTELIEPKEYKIGTIIPLIFTDIVGEENIQKGQVQVVNVEQDKVLASYDIMFWPE